MSAEPARKAAAKQARTKRTAATPDGDGRSPQPDATQDAPATAPALEITTSRQFAAWLAEHHVSLAFTTYQAGKLFLIGLGAENRLSVFERSFARCMGLCASDRGLRLATLYEIWRLENALVDGQNHDGFDALYVPQSCHVTGDLDVHDIAVDESGRLLFVNTLFSCLATVSDSHSFEPVWRPPFISRLAAEDRCHLNGLALFKGRPRFVTAVARSDVADGWREHRRDGGVVIDVASGKVVVDGLSMPHSPRVHKGRLWVLDSGTGYFGRVDVKAGKFVPLTFCPGYLRGLTFIDDFAVVGLSRPRGNATFADLPLQEALSQKQVEARCAIQVIDLKTGDIVHWLRLEGVVEELYDVVALPGVRKPMALGFKTDEIRRVITIPEDADMGAAPAVSDAQDPAPIPS